MDLRTDSINPDLLPALLQELADLIGLRPALALAQKYPGVGLYIPANPHPDHYLAQVIGFENLLKLSREYPQNYLSMPNVAVRKLRQQVVVDMRSRQISIRQTALATGYTQRRVEQLWSEAGNGHVNEHQDDLFNQEER